MHLPQLERSGEEEDTKNKKKSWRLNHKQKNENKNTKEEGGLMEGWDVNTKSTVAKIPLLTTRAGPRDGEAWTQRRKEEFMALIKYMEMNKAKDSDWFRIAPNADGTKWRGKCWYVHNLLRYEFDLQFDIPVTYPATAPELELPELDGKTAKMYRGGKICLTIHFKPLWAKNCPRFGIAHALCLGLGPWLAAEVPHLVDTGVIQHKEKQQQQSPASSQA